MALKLNKLFVRVPGEVSVESIVTLSRETGNDKKLYFLENVHQIVNNGIIYGVDPDTINDITDLQALIGGSSLADSSTPLITRLTNLEAISIADDSEDYLGLTMDSSQPVLSVNIVDIDTAQDGSHGLVDVANAKHYIDAEVAKATTEVVEGKGIDVTETNDQDGHTVYTIDASLALEYVAAVTEGTPSNAKIQLTDGNGNSFGEIDVANIIGNGILQGSSYNPATGILTLTFAEADGTPGTVEVDLHELLDLGDLMVKADSTDYLDITTVDSSVSDVNQAQFGIKIADVSTAAEGSTGLVDAYNVKQYILSQTADLTVDVSTKNAYIDASVDSVNNKKVNIEAQVDDLTATAGTAGVYDADGAQTTAPSHGTLTGVANTLTDGADVASKVKTYVDGELAIEAARADAKVLAAVKALGADVSTKGTNVSVGVTEVDGVITAVNVTESYANISYDKTNDTWTNTNLDGLLKGNDISTLIDYVDDKVGDTEISAQGDGKYIDASVDSTDKKKINVAANTANLGFSDPADASATLTGTADKLVDAADVANKVTSFVNARISEDIDALDSTITLTDSSSYVSTTVAEDNGKLASSGSSLTVQYGSMNGTTAGAATGGIAKAEDVQDFVDTYDFWETYSAS